jgi:hypothetical protein
LLGGEVVQPRLDRGQPPPRAPERQRQPEDQQQREDGDSKRDERGKG